MWQKDMKVVAQATSTVRIYKYKNLVNAVLGFALCIWIGLIYCADNECAFVCWLKIIKLMMSSFFLQIITYKFKNEAKVETRKRGKAKSMPNYSSLTEPFCILKQFKKLSTICNIFHLNKARKKACLKT